MALNPNVIVKVRFDVDRVLSRNNRVVSRVMRRLAEEMHDYTFAQVTKKDFPPASKPGTYPARRTGEFADSIEFRPVGRAIDVRVMRRGIWLETGTAGRAKPASRLPIPIGRGGRRKAHREKRSREFPGMAPRPWLSLALFARRNDWFKRATAIAREETGAD